MFWRIPNLSASSPVDFILDKENFTLEELLDEEEIIQECKALNARLINFLRDRAQVEQLLQYIVEDAPEDADGKRAFKFPFIACEIFTCEIDVILKTLVEDEDLMNKLFSFLEPNRTHNSTLAGYFSKVVVCLMLRKTASLMNYVQTHEVIFRQLVDLIGITSIMEILIRLAGADDHVYPNYIDIMQWLAETNLLEMIVDKLNPASSPEVHANAAEVLVVVIRNAPSALAAKLSTQSFISRIFDHALEPSPSKSSLVHALSVCIALLDPRRSAPTGLVHAIRNQHLYEPSNLVDSETIFAMFPKLGELLKLLTLPSDAITLPTTYGQLHPPLGKHRLKIVEFAAVLLDTGNEAAMKEVIQSGTIQRIIDLFFEYPFNNSLHHRVENMIISCLESRNTTFIDHIFCECNMLRKFLQADKTPFLSSDSVVVTMPAASRKPARIGNIGHITRISNKIVQLGNSNDQIQSYIQESGEWIDWQTNVLHERNAVENVYRWACGRPMALHERTRESDEDELHDRDYDIAVLANNLSQAFRYSVYENDEIDEVEGSFERDDEDIYFDDGSAEVVISSLSLGGNNQSDLFTNSNWFAFKEEGTTEDFAMSLDRMDDVNLNGSSVGGSSDNDDGVRGEVTYKIGTPENVHSGNDSVDESFIVGSTNAMTSSVMDDMSLFRFDTSENEDLFSDQTLPEWVGWREPSDIQVDGNPDVSNSSNTTENVVSMALNDTIETPSNDKNSCTSDSGELSREENTSCSFEEDAEFVGVDLEGLGKAEHQIPEEGMNSELGTLKRKFVLKVPELPEPSEDGTGIMEFSKSHWRVEPELGVVQE